MADFSYDWTGPEQVAFTSSVDQSAQYRQAVFLFIDYLRDLCGYTVERSSPGDGTSGAGDNIVDESDIVWGTADTENHTWAVLRPPTGKGNPSGGAQFAIIVDCVNAAADATPQTCNFIFGWGTVVSNGDANSRATVQQEESSFNLTNFIPWAAPAAGSICRWENSNNDFIFGIKLNGEAFFRCWIMIASDPDNAVGNNTLWMSAHASTNDQVTDSNLTASTGFRNMAADGSAAASNVNLFSTPFELTSWPNGQEGVSSRVMWRDVEVVSNGAAGSNRVLGLFRDVLACPRNTPFNQRDPDDNGNEAPYEWTSVGDLLLPSDEEVT